MKALAFSQDSAMLAVAQTDNIVYVYKIGSDWYIIDLFNWQLVNFITYFLWRGEKKSIVAKLVQNSAITCMMWLADGQIIFGLTDGKVFKEYFNFIIKY